jgi:hypothetical protein
MGVTQNIVQRVSKFFSQDKEQKNLQLSKGATNDRFDGSALEVLTTLGYDALGNYLRLENDLLNRFADYEEMDDYGEINSALDIIADDATQPDTTINRTVWVTSKDKTLQQNLDDLLNRTLRLDEEIWEIARTLSKYGNDYEEIIATDQGVRGLNYLPPATVRRIEGKRGDLLGFIQDFTGKFDYSNADYQQVLAAKFGGAADSNDNLDIDLLQNPIAAFEGWEVAHFRLRGKERRSVYGHSVLEGARWIWKRLMLLEDAALVYRLQRAPERFAFYIDTGDLPPNESLAFVNRVRQNFRKKKFVDPGNGKLNLKFDTLSPDEDFFIPSRKGVDSTRIENLGGPQWQAMDDIEYFRDKMFAAIKVPKAYLGQEQGVARAVLSSEDVRFARTVLRIQRELKNGIRKIIRVHLSALNIDPYVVEYDLHMTVPSAIFELAQMEVRTARADLAARMRDFVSLHWILTHVFGLSESEIKDIQKQRKGEAIDDAKTQADAMAASQPPMPEMGAEGGELPPEGEMPPEGEFGPPPEEGRASPIQTQHNVLTEKIHQHRMRAHRRGIPTHNYISDKELFEGQRTREADRRNEEKLQQLLRNDTEMSLRLRELGSFLKDLRAASQSRRGR